MSDQHVHVIAGVDTHGQTHHAAVIDSLGRHLADREFPATGSGYRQLLSWLGGHGTVQAVGVEGTGAYGGHHAARSTTVDASTSMPPRECPGRIRPRADPIPPSPIRAAAGSQRNRGG